MEAIGCETVHFLKSNWRRDLWEFFCYGPRGRMNTWLFFVKIDRHRTSGRFKRAGDFDKIWSVYQ